MYIVAVPNNHDLPITLMVNYSGDVNVPANEVNGWKRLPVDTGPSLGPFLSISYLLIDPAFCEPEVFFNSL